MPAPVWHFLQSNGWRKPYDYTLTEQLYLTGSGSGGSAAPAVLLPAVRGSICGSIRVRRAYRCELALTRSVDFSCGSASCAACSAVIGAYFYGVLSDEVIVHLWFDVNNSLWGERLHEGLNGGGKSRGALLQGASSDNKQMYTSVFFFLHLQALAYVNVSTWVKELNSSSALGTCFHERSWTRVLLSCQSASWTPSAPSTPPLGRLRSQMIGSSRPRRHCQTGADVWGTQALQQPCRRKGGRGHQLAWDTLKLQVTSVGCIAWLKSVENLECVQHSLDLPTATDLNFSRTPCSLKSTNKSNVMTKTDRSVENN